MPPEDPIDPSADPTAANATQEIDEMAGYTPRRWSPPPPLVQSRADLIAWIITAGAVIAGFFLRV